MVFGLAAGLYLLGVTAFYVYAVRTAMPFEEEAMTIPGRPTLTLIEGGLASDEQRKAA